MAKKQRKARTERQAQTDLVKLCAFIGIFLSAVLFVVGAVLNWLGMGKITSVLNLLAQIALLVAVAIPAYRFARGTAHRKAWTVIYWICLVIYVFGVVFGVVTVFVKF